jgi:hypothetical protein
VTFHSAFFTVEADSGAPSRDILFHRPAHMHQGAAGVAGSRSPELLQRDVDRDEIEERGIEAAADPLC